MMLLYIFAFVVVINCAYYVLFSKFSFLDPSEEIPSEKFPVSLVVCAKNEAENLSANIPLWLEQKHPEFELILINDASSDESLEIMESFAETDSRIQVVNVVNNETFWASKKYALTLGIKRAKYKRLLFTDADCKPSSDQWMSIMSSHFSEKKQLILGYGGYKKQKGILNSLIRFETLLTALQYFSYAKAGTPYMGVGRNLAYTSDIYYDNRGFISHIKIPSGDDDLFVNEVATAENTAICYHKDAFTYSLPKQTWKAWRLQKKRHLTTAKLYKAKHQFLLGTHYAFTVLFWMLLMPSFIFLDWKIPLALLLFRILIQYIVFGKAAKKLHENDLVPFLPLLELFLVCIQMSIFISNSFSKPNRWK